MSRWALLLLATAFWSGGCSAPDLASVSTSSSRETAAWRPVDAETGRIADVEGLTALAEAFPDSANVRVRLLNAQLRSGNLPEALVSMRWLNERGYLFGESARAQIPDLFGADYAEEARALLLPPARPLERSTLAFTVPAEAGLVESVIVEESPKRMVATSVIGRSIWGTTPDGSWKAVAPQNADNLSGIADEGGEVLWVASGNIDQSKDSSPGFSGLIGLRGALPEIRVAAPEGVTLSDLHLAVDGSLFASDPIGGGVYKLGPERRTLETLVAPGTLRSPQGMATSADGKHLYVSDYRYGIAIVTLATARVTRLESHVPAILDGTDALFRRGNSLIAIQNGTNPPRIAQFDLSDDGLRIARYRILEQAHAEWTEPLSGHLGEDALFYVGNGQWDKYIDGRLAEGKQAEPVQIRRLPLD